MRRHWDRARAVRLIGVRAARLMSASRPVQLPLPWLGDQCLTTGLMTVPAPSWCSRSCGLRDVANAADRSGLDDVSPHVERSDLSGLLNHSLPQLRRLDHLHRAPKPST